jgi:hypothetical protein
MKMSWLLLTLSAALAGCVAPRTGIQAMQGTDGEQLTLQVTHRIVYDGAGTFILPDGVRVAADANGGFVLPNGAYVRPDGTGGVILPNGARCGPDGSGGYICA